MAIERSDAGSDSDATDPVDRVIRYHLRTKHHFGRYARSLGHLDWANQPDPFRRFIGSELIGLPLLRPEGEPQTPVYDAIYRPGAVPVQTVNLRSISRFFELALAVSAWKQAGETQWALRSNPSSGNLHPTEGYAAFPRIVSLQLKPGLYHYAPREHGLEFRARFSPAVLEALLAPYPAGAFLFGLSSVHWREAWKYGERAYRYCQHDVGHAIGSARIAAATLGWHMVMLDCVDQDTVATILGLDRSQDFSRGEMEYPECLLVVWPGSRVDGSCGDELQSLPQPARFELALVQELARGPWYGRANRLSREHAATWDVIDDVARAAWKHTRTASSAAAAAATTPSDLSADAPERSWNAGEIIRQRRSALAFDGRTCLSAPALLHTLQRVMPHEDVRPVNRCVPWDVWPYDPTIHLLLFIHRVDGLEPGVYFLLRNHRRLESIQQMLDSRLTWSPVANGASLPLYRLMQGDATTLAAQVSCFQSIAGDCAVSLGMFAEFDGPLRERGAWWYPRMFWESGLLGQVLYLEAEAAGVRATGIGCFFDDPVHEIVGLKGTGLQSLYHFAIGGPIEDTRLLTLPAYGHLEAARSI